MERRGDLLLQVAIAPVPEIARRRVAVRDQRGVLGDADPLDERARRSEEHVRVGGDPESARRVGVERKKKTMALAEQETLQVADPEVPSRKRPVARPIVEERIDRRVGPHLVQRLDDALRPAMGDEVLVRESELHRPRTRARRTSATKTGSARCRRQRRGSKARRHSHSNPIAWTKRGGTRTRPAS